MSHPARFLSLALALALALLILSGCASATPTPIRQPTQRSPVPTFTARPATATATVAALALAVNLTDVPNATPPPATPLPVTSAPTAADAIDCSLDAVFVSDLSVPDGMTMPPGEVFNKEWLLHNSGLCAWPANTSIRFVGGEQLCAQDSVPVPGTEPGQDAAISVAMRVPAQPGDYRGEWQLHSNDEPFGETVWVRIVVPGTPTTMPPPATATPVGMLAVAAPTNAPAAAAAAPAAQPTSQPALTGDLGYTCDRCIKGNISQSTGEKIYHLPGCTYYDRTVINPEYGERYFSSEAEARAAGWRKAKGCH